MKAYKKNWCGNRAKVAKVLAKTYRAKVCQWHTRPVSVCMTRKSYSTGNYLELGSISPTCLQKVFTNAYPKSAKRQSSHQCLFALSGSAHEKSARKMLLKLTPVVGKESFWTKNICLFLQKIQSNRSSKNSLINYDKVKVV